MEQELVWHNDIVKNFIGHNKETKYKRKKGVGKGRNRI